MPVSFTVAKHPANPVKYNEEGRTARQLLDSAAREQSRQCGEMLQCTLDGTHVSLLTPKSPASNTDLSIKIPYLIPSNNGFFQTVLTAYNTHHALVIRPDDVCISKIGILSKVLGINSVLSILLSSSERGTGSA
ncbi:hypothetical protein C8R47DRAFT_1201161 [Mycena vitilis]|nr:hypothetical protein C8R47DRAFT_1201161 [Mycena vitilis]